MFSVRNHILHKGAAPVAQRSTPNKGGVIKPSLLVMHYTASQSAAGAISWLCNPKAKASAHLVIDQQGNVTQLAPLNVSTWHAGRSEWKGRSGCNSFSIGIEMVNPGWLAKDGDGKFRDSTGKAFPASMARKLRHKHESAERWWAAYPEAQIDAAVEVAAAICEAYGIKDIAGHEDIARGRKSDPGAAFPMQSFIGRVEGRKGEDDDGEDDAAPVPPGSTTTGLRRGDEGESVVVLQRALNKHGAALKVDGDFGPGTEAAVRAFQVSRGLPVNGVVGLQTWDALK